MLLITLTPRVIGRITFVTQPGSVKQLQILNNTHSVFKTSWSRLCSGEIWWLNTSSFSIWQVLIVLIVMCEHLDAVFCFIFAIILFWISYYSKRCMFGWLESKSALKCERTHKNWCAFPEIDEWMALLAQLESVLMKCYIILYQLSN